MKPRWVLWLYPPAWRERYRAELEALIEDAGPGRGDTFDLFKEAIRMRVLESWSFSQLAVVLGIAGLLAGAGVFAIVPSRWVSQTELKMSAPARATGDLSRATVDQQLTGRFLKMRNDTLSRTSLSAIIQAPELDLYKKERESQPLEDVIAQMKRNLHVDLVRLPASGIAFRIWFRYPDRLKALKTVQKLIATFADANVAVDSDPRWADGEHLDIVQSPTLDASVFEMREDLKGIALITILFGVAGVVVAAIAKLLFRMSRFQVLAPVLGTIGMAAGVLIAFFPWSHVSHAELMMTLSGTGGASAVEREATGRFNRLRDSILSTNSLSEIILDPRLNLYAGERKSGSAENAVERMRRDIGVTTAPGSSASGPIISLSFRYPDRYKAQQTLQALVNKLADADIQARAQPLVFRRKLPLNLDVLDPPSLPRVPSGPNPWMILSMGLGTGIVLAILTKLAIRARGDPAA
jgi:hypothetical protein